LKLAIVFLYPGGCLMSPPHGSKRPKTYKKDGSRPSFSLLKNFQQAKFFLSSSTNHRVNVV
jgi:hypothetical protein